MVLYARSNCDDDTSELGCSDGPLASDDEQLTLSVTAGVPITIFVDGFLPGEEGPYTLTLSLCGDAVLTSPEVCDDGNTTDGDGCDSNCTITACGNGITAGAEECDDGNTIDGDGCDSDCSLICGAGLGGSAALLDNVSGRCLLRFDEADTWPNAEAICEAFSGTLAVVNNTQENTLLSSLTGNPTWIGLNDIATEGTFVWANNDPVTFTSFSAGEPNNFNGIEDCVEMLGTLWNDIPCGDTRRFVCELP